MARELRNWYSAKWQDLMAALATLASGQNPDGSNYTLPVDLGITPVDGNTTGATAAVAATGSWTINSAPANNDTITVNGAVFTFKTSAVGATQIQISPLIGGSGAVETAANAASKLNASTDPLVSVATYAEDGSNLHVTHDTPGAAGNAFTLAKNGVNLEVSGATLTGGADAIADPVEPLLPVSLRFTGPGGSVEAGTAGNGLHVAVDGGTLDGISNTLNVQLMDGNNNAISFVSDGNGGWAIPVKVFP